MNPPYTTRPEGDYAVAERDDAHRMACAVCHGDGYVMVRTDEGYDAVKDCPDCKGIDARIKRFNLARIPARYHAKDFLSFHTYFDDAHQQPIGNLTDVKSKLYRYAGGFWYGDRGVLLVGPVGTGKTHLLAALARYLTLDKGISARFVEFTHLLGELKEAYETRTRAQAIMDQLAGVPVLLIDELGKGRKTQWQLDVLDELISKRYNACLSTFFTTNYALDASRKFARPTAAIDTNSHDFRASLETETLADRVGERIVSRICEMADVLEFRDVPDHRRR